MGWTRFFRRSRRDDEAAREIASYIAIETDDNIARGMAPQAAHDAAVRKFGNATRVREEIYWMNTMRPDRHPLAGSAFAARAAEARQGLCRGRDSFAGARHRRQHRDLPVARRGAAAHAAGRAEPQQLVNVSFRAGLVAQRRLHQPLAGSDLRAGRASCAQHQQAFRGLARVEQRPAQHRGRRGSAATSRRCGRAATCSPCSASSRVVGRLFSRRGRSPAARARGGDQLRLLAARVWRLAVGAAADRASAKASVRHRRRDRAVVLRARRRPRFDVAVPLCADLLLQNGAIALESTPRVVAGGRWAASRPAGPRQQANDHLIAMSPAIMADDRCRPDYTAEAMQKHYLGNKLNALPRQPACPTCAKSSVSRWSCCWPRPALVLADRVRQPGQPAAGARDRPRARDRGAPRDRRVARRALSASCSWRACCSRRSARCSECSSRAASARCWSRSSPAAWASCSST